MDTDRSSGMINGVCGDGGSASTLSSFTGDIPATPC
jgi:hypothetical protein